MTSLWGNPNFAHSEAFLTKAIEGEIILLGLFTADQNLRGKHTSKHTRQNPKGNRYGYECPEERDYYPYWHATDWVDIAVLVDKPSDCAFYKRESFNVKEKGECTSHRAL